MHPMTLAAVLSLVSHTCQAQDNRISLNRTRQEIALLRMDSLMAVVNKQYRIYASLKVSENSSAPYKQAIFFEGLIKDKPCNISSWKICDSDVLHSTKPTYSCYCSSKYNERQEGVVVYRFYYYIDEVLQEFDNRPVSVRLGDICKATGKLRVVHFQEKPTKTAGGDVQVCFKTKTKLSWVYSKNAITSKRYQIELMQWSILAGSVPHTIAVLSYDESRKHLVTVPSKYRAAVRVEVDPATSRYMLIILKDFVTREMVIKVTVKFNKTRHDEVKATQNEQIDWIRGTLTLTSAKDDNANNRKRRALNVPTSVNASGSGMNDKSLTHVTPRTKTSFITTHEIFYRSESDSIEQLIDNVTIYPLIPPASHTEAKIEMKITAADRVLITCSTRGSMGDPPVNLTLWRVSKDGVVKVMATKQDVTTLRFVLPQIYNSEDSYVYSCGLTGLTLACLSKNAPPRKNASTSVNLEDESEGEIEWLLVLYGAETFIVICILMWTLSNLMQHIRLILWCERTILAEQNKHFDTSNINDQISSLVNFHS